MKDSEKQAANVNPIDGIIPTATADEVQAKLNAHIADNNVHTVYLDHSAGNPSPDIDSIVNAGTYHIRYLSSSRLRIVYLLFVVRNENLMGDTTVYQYRLMNKTLEARSGSAYTLTWTNWTTIFSW